VADAATRFDILILGGGSGGYACALRASELGMSVGLVEEDKVGGTCLHRGCIPTKALLHTAAVLDEIKESAALGIQVAEPTLDLVKAQDLYRYDPRGNRHLNTTAADTAYFSIDGLNQLMRYNQNATGDFSDWWSPSGHPNPHVQDAFATPAVIPAMDVEWVVLDVLGVEDLRHSREMNQRMRFSHRCPH